GSLPSRPLRRPSGAPHELVLLRLTSPVTTNPPAMAVAEAATKYGARSCWLLAALVVVVIEAVAVEELDVERAGSVVVEVAGWLLVEVAVVLDEEVMIIELDEVVVELLVLVVVTAGRLV